jgi:hypothetical protein
MGFARNPNGTGSFVIQSPTFNTFNSATGLEESDKQTSFYFFPNPASEQLFLETKKPTRITLQNSLGQIIMEISVNGKQNLSIEGLVSGVYFLQSSTETQKLLIVK